MIDVFDDRKQFEELHKQLVRHARKLLYRFPAVERECDAEDLVAESMYRLQKHREAGGEHVENIGGWLYRTMNHYVQDRNNKLRRERRLPETYEPKSSRAFAARDIADEMVDLGLEWRAEADRAHGAWPSGKKINYFAVLLVLLRQNTCIHLAPHVVEHGGGEYRATLLDNLVALYPWHASEEEAVFKSGFPNLEETWSALFAQFLRAPSEYSPQVVAEHLDSMSPQIHLPASTWYQWCKRARGFLDEAFQAIEVTFAAASPLWDNARLRNESASQ